MEIICRHAKNDFEALMTAQGMEDAGASVFSITLNSGNDSFRFIVFAKYDPACIVSPDKIDVAIEKRLWPDDSKL